jgi:hypothetical protein
MPAARRPNPGYARRHQPPADGAAAPAKR